MHFTNYPTHLQYGTLLTYSFQRINFNNQSTSSSVNDQSSNNTTTPIPSPQANADFTKAAATPIPLPQANNNINNALTTPSSEWRIKNVEDITVYHNKRIVTVHVKE